MTSASDSAGISADDFATELDSARSPGDRPDTSTDASADAQAKSYDSLVWSAVQSAGLVLVVKILAVVVLARFMSASVGLDFWFGVVPHLQFATDAGSFTLIVTLSTIAMGIAAVALAALTFLGHLDDSRQRVVGRAVASVIVLQTFGLELYRHQVQDETIRWSLAWLVIVAGLGGITLLAMSLWKDRGGELNSVKENQP